MTIDIYNGEVPNRSTQTQAQFSTNTDNLLAYVIETFVPQLNSTAVGSTSSGVFGSVSIGNGSPGAGGLFFTNDIDTNIYRPTSGAIGFATDGSNRMTVSATGLAVQGRVSTSLGSVADPSFKSAAFPTSGMYLPGGNVAFAVSGNEIFRATSDAVRIGQDLQNLPGVSNTQDGVGVQANGRIASSAFENVPLSVNRNSNNGAVVSIRRQGLEVGNISSTTTAVSYNTSSDYRMKYDMPDDPSYDPVAKVENLASKLRWYGWNSDVSAEAELGWYAHELQEIEPRAVTHSKDLVDKDGWPVMQGRDDSKLIVHLVAAVAALSKRIKELEDLA